MQFRRFAWAGITVFLLAVSLSGSSSAQSLGHGPPDGGAPTGLIPQPAPSRALVGANPGFRGQAERAVRASGGRIRSFHEQGDFFVVDTPSLARDWARLMRGRPGVRFAEPDYVVKSSVEPNDPEWFRMWGLKKIGMPTVWDRSKGSKDVVVGVIDTGVDYRHSDITTAQMWVNPRETSNGVDDDQNGYVDDLHGADCRNNDGDPMDDHGHGTHVAGTIGAASNNSKGVPGINWDVKVMALKFMDSSGSGFLSDAVKCLDYAVRNGAHVTNNSWGGGGYSQALFDAINRARVANQLFVAAAGNEGIDLDQNPSYPASYPHDNIISVAATNSSDIQASFSNFGRRSVDLAAPGVGIFSTVLNGGYASWNGTSMAAPHVTGTAALLMAVHGPDVPYKNLIDAIYRNVDIVGDLTRKVATGGRLNAVRAAQGTVSLKAPAPVPAPGWAWGYNAWGQLGTGGANDQIAPVLTSSPADLTEVSAGFVHSLALTEEGTVRAWGYNEYGQLGNSTRSHSKTPVVVQGATDMKQVSAGLLHSTALEEDGTVWDWGWNAVGQLGDGTTLDRAIPVQVSGLDHVVQVSAGGLHNLALKDDGTVWAWGWNAVGQLGDGTTINRHVAVKVPGLTDVAWVAAGGLHSLAVGKDGSLWSWGWNHFGQLGDRTTVDRHRPVLVTNASNVYMAAAGYVHSLALKEDRTVLGWGFNALGQVGNGTTTDQHSATPVFCSGGAPGCANSSNSAVWLSAGGYHSLAMTQDGSVWGWGYNAFGLLGDGSTTNRLVPARGGGGGQFQDISAGFFHNLALGTR